MWENTIFLVQNKFLLLVALTPVEYLNPLRSRLQEVSLDSLRKVKYDNFQVLVLGDKEYEEGKLSYIKAPNGSKGLRLKFALEYIEKHNLAYDYIARFDDDDVLNSQIFEQYANSKSACIADRFHAYYDLNSHLTITEEKNWLANTVFLKKEHALAMCKDGRTLIEQDHALEWHSYFQKKEVLYTKSQVPIYLRVLSPTSITSTTNDNHSYATYLDSFGDWLSPIHLPDFESSIAQLEKVHNEFYPEGKYTPVNTSLLRRGIRAIKRLFKIGT